MSLQCFDLFKWLQQIQNWTIIQILPIIAYLTIKLVGNSKVSTRVLYMSCDRGVWPTCSLSARTCSITLDHKATRPSSLSTVSGLLAKKNREVDSWPNSSWFTYYSCQLGLNHWRLGDRDLSDSPWFQYISIHVTGMSPRFQVAR